MENLSIKSMKKVYEQSPVLKLIQECFIEEIEAEKQISN